MSEPLRWSSISTSVPPILLAAASDSPAVTWAGRQGEIYCQASPTSEPSRIATADDAPLDLATSSSGAHVAWLTKKSVGLSPASGGDVRKQPGTFGGIVFVDGHLLCAPTRTTGNALILTRHVEETHSIPLNHLDVAGLAGVLRDHGVGAQTEVTALWVAVLAGLTEAEEIVLGKRSQRRELQGARLVSNASGHATLLVYRRGGRLTRLVHADGDWQRVDLKAPQRERLAEGRDACLDSRGRHVAAPLDSGNVTVFDASGNAIATWRPRSPGRPLTFRADGPLLLASTDGGLDVWRVPGLGDDVQGSSSALACAGVHLSSYALRCVQPADRPVAPSIHLLARLWTVGLYPPLVWVHDLLGLLEGGVVGIPPGMDPERAPEDYRQALQRIADSSGLRRLRGIRPGRAALETAVARLLRDIAQKDTVEGLRPPDGEIQAVKEALLRSSGNGGAFHPQALLPPGTLNAWEKALNDLDLDELRTVDLLGDAALGLPGCLADGFSLDILPDAVRAVLNAVLRILPRQVEGRRQRGQGAAVTGFGGYGEIARKGNLDNLLATEHAYPRQLLWGRLLQGEALYYGRESTPPSLHESTWLVLDASAAMTGDPLLLARAIGVAAARLARRNVEFRFFDAALGPSQALERPGDVWQLIHGQPQLPPAEGEKPNFLQGTAAVWQGLAHRLQARANDNARTHVLVISHEFLGAEEGNTVVDGLTEVHEQADLRLVLIQFPDMRSYFERNSSEGNGKKQSFEPWLTKGPSLVPERPPWKALKERGVPVALVPVTRLWGTDE